MSHLARVAVPICLLLSIALVAPASAEVFVEKLDASEPAQVEATSPAPKLADGPAVVLPYYRSKVAGAPGENTYFAVRNNGSEALAIRLSYYDFEGGSAARVDETVLDGHAVGTVNVREVAGLPRRGAITRGYLVVEALDSTLPTNVLSGDYFRTDANFAEANGGTMPTAEESGCRSWSHRFLNGGGFDGGTRIAFLVLDAPSQGPVLTGNVYNEAGELIDVISVRSTDVAFELSDEDLELPVSFGSIDWIFEGDGHGLISTTYTASGVLSVGMEATCTDGAEAPAIPGSELFQLAGNFLTCNGCANWQYDMPFGGSRQFSKVVIDFDVYIAGWDPAKPNGFHCIFWLNNGDRWQDMMGYLNSRGTQNRTVFQSNGPLGNPIGVETYRSPGVQVGQTYHVHYEYDTIEKRVWYEIRTQSGEVRVSDSIPLPPNTGPLSTSRTFIQFGSQPSSIGPEALTEGWRWSNFKALFLP